ncbi:hypothetical protein D3C72_2491090 [compost metagenome]
MLAGLGITLYYMLSHTKVVQQWVPNVLLADGLWWGLQPISAGVFGVLVGVIMTVMVSCFTAHAYQKSSE